MKKLPRTNWRLASKLCANAPAGCRQRLPAGSVLTLLKVMAVAGALLAPTEGQMDVTSCPAAREKEALYLPCEGNSTDSAVFWELRDLDTGMVKLVSSCFHWDGCDEELPRMKATAIRLKEGVKSSLHIRNVTADDFGKLIVCHVKDIPKGSIANACIVNRGIECTAKKFERSMGHSGQFLSTKILIKCKVPDVKNFTCHFGINSLSGVTPIKHLNITYYSTENDGSARQIANNGQGRVSECSLITEAEPGVYRYNVRIKPHIGAENVAVLPHIERNTPEVTVFPFYSVKVESNETNLKLCGKIEARPFKQITFKCNATWHLKNRIPKIKWSLVLRNGSNISVLERSSCSQEDKSKNSSKLSPYFCDRTDDELVYDSFLNSPREYVHVSSSIKLMVPSTCADEPQAKCEAELSEVHINSYFEDPPRMRRSSPPQAFSKSSVMYLYPPSNPPALSDEKATPLKKSMTLSNGTSVTILCYVMGGNPMVEWIRFSCDSDNGSQTILNETVYSHSLNKSNQKKMAGKLKPLLSNVDDRFIAVEVKVVGTPLTNGARCQCVAQHANDCYNKKAILSIEVTRGSSSHLSTGPWTENWFLDNPLLIALGVLAFVIMIVLIAGAIFCKMKLPELYSMYAKHRYQNPARPTDVSLRDPQSAEEGQPFRSAPREDEYEEVLTPALSAAGDGPVTLADMEQDYLSVADVSDTELKEVRTQPNIPREENDYASPNPLPVSFRDHSPPRQRANDKPEVTAPLLSADPHQGTDGKPSLHRPLVSNHVQVCHD